MTERQKQHLLGYLGHYNGAVDGIWGPASRQAARSFQQEQGIGEDEAFGQESQSRILAVIGAGEKAAEPDFWADIRYFDREEFRCTCGGRGCDGFPAEPQETLVRNAERIRTHFGCPVMVSSGVRCRLRNGELPGSTVNSLHLQGRAMDFCVRGKGAAPVLEFVKQLPQVREAYAIDGSYVHLGVE